nr:Unknown Function [uncultured bacterium]
MFIYIALYAVANFVANIFVTAKFPTFAKWKRLAISLGITIPLYLLIVGLYHFYFADPIAFKQPAWEGVDWRSEISQADEPKTWPFKEPSYMLGCQGINGNYSVYLVKTEDIDAKSGRARPLVPQYYGLKGSLPRWEKGETQLLDGQSAEVFKKYVDYSLELCKKAESMKNNKSQVPVDKKQQQSD